MSAKSNVFNRLRSIVRGRRKPAAADRPAVSALPANSGSPTDRRQHQRRTLNCVGSLHSGGQQKSEAVILDVSETGVRVNAALPLGTVHDLSFKLPGTEVQINARAEVVWTNSRDRAGIRFAEIPEQSQRELLSAWLQHMSSFVSSGGLHSSGPWAGVDFFEDAILIHDEQFRILAANRSLLHRLHKQEIDVVEKTCAEVLPHASDWQGCPYCSQVVTGFGETPDPCLGGLSVVSTSASRELGNYGKGTLHIIRDVTSQRTAEQKYRLLFEQVLEGVFTINPDGHILDCNDKLARMLGYASRSELLGSQSMRELYPAPADFDKFCRKVAAKSFVRNSEIRLRRRDGGFIDVLKTAFVTRDTLHNVVCYQGYVVDVTEQRRALNEAERRNRELWAVNSIAAAATRSMNLDEILHRSVQLAFDLLSPDTAGVYLLEEKEHLLRWRAGLGNCEPAFGMEFPEQELSTFINAHAPLFTRKDVDPPLSTRAQHTQFIAALLWDADKFLGLLVAGVASDRKFTPVEEDLVVAISRQLATSVEKIRLYQETRQAYQDLREAQERLLQSDKMAAVGQLTAGVAHELNNPLAAILGYGQLLQDQQLPPDSREQVERIYKQAQRMHRIIQNLLSFSRKRNPQKRCVDLHSVVEEALFLCEHELRVKKIALEISSEFPLPPVIADPHQLEQVFLNIVNNAVDAMQGQTTPGKLKVSIGERDGCVFVRFTDNGPGLKEPKRVFDPFYTTKDVGRGTGLGLSICYGIVQEHGGEIIAANSAQGGAELEIRVPAVSHTAIKTGQRTADLAPLNAKNASILILEHDATVRDILNAVLPRTGARVQAVANTESAMAHIKNENFDLFLLNGDKPGDQGGIALYHWIVRNRPRMKQRILMTFSDFHDGAQRLFVEQTSVRRMLKPLELTELTATLRSLLKVELPAEAAPVKVPLPGKNKPVSVFDMVGGYSD